MATAFNIVPLNYCTVSLIFSKFLNQVIYVKKFQNKTRKTYKMKDKSSFFLHTILPVLLGKYYLLKSICSKLKE